MNRSSLRAVSLGWVSVSVALVLASARLGQAQENGRALFDGYGCYQCHGHEGQGGAAPRIAPSLYPYEAFERLVRRPANEMPAYAPAALSDETLRAIYRYVREVPEPPKVVDIPLLR
jgi:mono/diheme cytochrome c family protein